MNIDTANKHLVMPGYKPPEAAKATFKGFDGPARICRTCTWNLPLHHFIKIGDSGIVVRIQDCVECQLKANIESQLHDSASNNEEQFYSALIRARIQYDDWLAGVLDRAPQGRLEKLEKRALKMIMTHPRLQDFVTRIPSNHDTTNGIIYCCETAGYPRVVAASRDFQRSKRQLPITTPKKRSNPAGSQASYLSPEPTGRRKKVRSSLMGNDIQVRTDTPASSLYSLFNDGETQRRSSSDTDVLVSADDDVIEIIKHAPSQRHNRMFAQEDASEVGSLASHARVIKGALADRTGSRELTRTPTFGREADEPIDSSNEPLRVASPTRDGVPGGADADASESVCDSPLPHRALSPRNVPDAAMADGSDVTQFLDKIDAVHANSKLLRDKLKRIPEVVSKEYAFVVHDEEKSLQSLAKSLGKVDQMISVWQEYDQKMESLRKGATQH